MNNVDKPIMLIDKYSDHIKVLTAKTNGILSVTSQGEAMEFYKDSHDIKGYVCQGQYWVIPYTNSMTITTAKGTYTIVGLTDV